MGLWLVIGGAVAIAVICVVLLQKKAGEAKKYFDELNEARSRLEQKDSELAESQTAVERSGLEQQDKLDDLAANLKAVRDQNSQLNEELDGFNQKLRVAEEEKSAEINELIQKLQAAEVEKSATAEELAVTVKKLEDQQAAGNEVDALSLELASVKSELEKKNEQLATVEQRFEEKMQEVVQSSIDKITHAEEAKEEAIQAAQDNFEAAAEANVRLKEKEELIRKLQGQ